MYGLKSVCEYSALSLWLPGLLAPEVVSLVVHKRIQRKEKAYLSGFYLKPGIAESFTARLKPCPSRTEFSHTL
jgi:hypothetical protein